MKNTIKKLTLAFVLTLGLMGTVLTGYAYHKQTTATKAEEFVIDYLKNRDYSIEEFDAIVEQNQELAVSAYEKIGSTTLREQVVEMLDEDPSVAQEIMKIISATE